MSSIDAHTRLVLLFGYPVEHSLSPLMHNAAFRHQRVNAVYLAAPVPPHELQEAVAGLQAVRGLGANVTIPHKQAMRDLVDELSPRAAAVGAVNTLVIRREADEGPVLLYGDNTDVPGFLAPLEPHASTVRGSDMLVFGAGGAARAVVYALLTHYMPSRLTIAARRPEQAEHLAADLAAQDTRSALVATSLAEAGPAVRASRLLVNATPLGMYPKVEGTPWMRDSDFGAGQVVYDLIYNPGETRVMRDAAARGATPIGGLAMLIGQAAASYEQWTGRPMPIETVREALHAAGVGKVR